MRRVKHGPADTRMPRLAALAAGLFVASSACVLVLLAAAIVFIHPAHSAQAAENTATVGDLHYAVENAWILEPHRRVDAQVARGLPAADRHLGPDELLYAVFVGVTNESDRRLPLATHVALRDVTNREYSPVPLGATNRYAYRSRTMAPRSHRPAPWTPAGEDLSADGLMLVFRIPRQAYDDGSLELLVRDPGDPAAVSSMQVL
jgi:hypothetical protein